MVIKLSKWNSSSAEWIDRVVTQSLLDGYIQIIEDAPYDKKATKEAIKHFLNNNGVKDVRFRVPPGRIEEPQKEIKGNIKTFRDFFLGKHPDCDVKRLGIAGEKASVKLDRLFQTMADYMDYLMERNEQ